MTNKREGIAVGTAHVNGARAAMAINTEMFFARADQAIAADARAEAT